MMKNTCSRMSSSTSTRTLEQYDALVGCCIYYMVVLYQGAISQ